MKVKTKTQIVLTAIELFNLHGFSNVSLLKIAKTLNLSPGNLTYHYQKKADLMVAVYLHFQEELLKVLPDEADYTSIKDLDKQITSFYSFQKRFKFFYLDLLEVSRAFPSIGNKHVEHIDGQIDRLYRILSKIASDTRLKSYQSEQTYKQLAHQMWMTSVFWMSQSMVRSQEHELNGLRDSLWFQIYPQLTESGKEELAKFIDIEKFK